jgi:L-serine/L-threonine ammonia-lyase
MLVELACAATLTSAYSPALFEKLVPRRSNTRPTVVFIVCGGFKISLGELAEYQSVLETKEKQKPQWDVLCNGELWAIAKN